MQDSNLTLTDPLVSIAVCTYNGERFLAKQLDSILNQTYKNIEVIVVDDCSSDRTVEILKETQNKDSRLKYFVNERNLGYNKNFEKAVTICTGDYIAISDQDDIWLPNKIVRLLSCIDGKLMVYGNSAFINEEDKLMGSLIIHPSQELSKVVDYRNILIENFVTGHNVLFSRKALEFILPFPEKSFYDWWMGFVMLYENQLCFCDEVVTHYRVHTSSVINLIKQEDEMSFNKNQEKYCLQQIQVLEYFKSYKNLKRNDAKFLEDLYEAFIDKLNSYYSTKLYAILYHNFKPLFPGYKKSYIKRLPYIYRYSRGIKLFAALAKFRR
jgi:glycosyltransferase involved in cell wall biosynthesis